MTTFERFICNPTSFSWAVGTTTLNPLRDVVYNDVLNLWCAVGDASTILTSPDGVTWTAQAGLGAGVQRIYERVAVGDSGMFVAQRYQNIVDVSSDGATWVQKSLGQTHAIDRARAITYSPSLDRWVAVAVTNAEQSWTSDATTTPWSNTFGLMSATQALWDNVNNLYVFASGNNRIVVTSPDGTGTVTLITQPGTKDGSDNADAIAWDGANTYIVVMGHAGDTSTSRMWRNTSGNPTSGLWSDVTHPFGAHKITSITYSPTLNVWRACAAAGNLIGISIDGGATWTLETGVPTATSLNGIWWSEELQQFAVVGSNGTAGVLLVGS